MGSETDYALVLGGIVGAHVLAIISPGPNFLIVTQTSMSHSRRAGMAAALGIAAGAGLWSASVVLGLSVLLAHFGWLHAGLKLLGGAYLIYLGLRLWIAARRPLEMPAPSGASAAKRSTWPDFRRGLLTNLTNPKAAIFYGSIFAAFLVPGLPAWVRLTAVGLIFANSAVWHMVLAWLFSTRRAQEMYGQGKLWIDRGAGAALAAMGLLLVAQNR